MDPNEEQQPAPHSPPAPAATLDAPDQETMEQIRRRRLERLVRSGSGPTSGPGTPTAESSRSTTPVAGRSVAGSPVESRPPVTSITRPPAATPKSENVNRTGS